MVKVKIEKVFYKYRVCKDLMGWQIWSQTDGMRCLIESLGIVFAVLVEP